MAVRSARARARRPTPRPRVDVRKTYKLYIGGAVPALRVGPLVRRRARADGTPLANAVRGSRKDLRDAVRAARGAFRRLGRQDGHEPRPDPLPRGRADGGPPRPVRGRGRGRRGPAGAAAPRAGRPGDRPLGLVRGLGRQDHPGRSARSTRSRRRYFNFTIPEPTGVVGDRRPGDVVAARASSRASRRSLVAATRAVVLASESRPLPAVTLGEVLATSRRAGRRRQHPHRPAARARARRSPRTWTSTRSTPGACPTTSGESSRRRHRERQARRPPAARRRRALRLARRPRGPAAGVDRRVPGDEDRLAPDRRLIPQREVP